MKIVYTVVVSTQCLVKTKTLLIENLGNEFFADENKANYDTHDCNV